MMNWRPILVLAAAMSAGVVPVDAQVATGEEDVVDRVVAIVGDSVVLMTQVQEEIERLRLQGATVPDNPTQLAAMQREVLDTWVNRVLVLQAAANDTLIDTVENIPTVGTFPYFEDFESGAGGWGASGGNNSCS